MRRIGVEQRRARLALRHHLAPAARSDDAATVARDLVGLHGTDPASVFLAAWARLRAPEVGAIQRAMYDERSLLRILGMRRTMFVVTVDLLPVVHAACTRAIAAQQRKLLVQLLAQAGVADDPDGWLREVEEATMRALAGRGEALAAELSQDVPGLREQLHLAVGKPYEAKVSISTRVLFLMAADGLVVRGRPRGSWTSSQFRWAPLEKWLPGGVPEVPVEAAQAELVRRWLAAFGPGTVADLKWWTGLTAGAVKRALAQVEPAEVELDGGTGLVLPGDLEPVPAPAPWAALLPALDPTAMGWAGRAWYLGEHGPALFDRSGNVGPTVWWQGRIVGGWAQRKDGEIALRLLEDVGADAAAAVEAEAERLRRWFGPVRVTPRFRTPLERELVA
ncbi:MAG TPA: winged helix DNA-binding domain-containing protein [Actinomycetes bacterium]